jgi:hypothetical protein
MLLDYMPGGPIGASQLEIAPVSVARARACVRDVACGLAYLHFHNVVHRDLKPANILRSSAGRDERFVIGDFGVSLLCEDGSDLSTGNFGTLPFKPPEAHDARGGSFSGKAADAWSLGVTLFQLVYGTLPFYDDDLLEFGVRVCAEPLVFPPNRAHDARLEDVLSRLLCKEPAARLTPTQLLAHPWLRDEHRVAELLQPVYAAISVTSDDLSRALRSMLSFRMLATHAVDEGRCGGGAGTKAVRADAAVRVRVAIVVLPLRVRAAGARGARASTGGKTLAGERGDDDVESDGDRSACSQGDDDDDYNERSASAGAGGGPRPLRNRSLVPRDRGEEVLGSCVRVVLSVSSY